MFNFYFNTDAEKTIQGKLCKVYVWVYGLLEKSCTSSNLCRVRHITP